VDFFSYDSDILKSINVYHEFVLSDNKKNSSLRESLKHTFHFKEYICDLTYRDKTILVTLRSLIGISKCVCIAEDQRVSRSSNTAVSVPPGPS
jgi:hypothetical protein